jgi:hypothetical protein
MLQVTINLNDKQTKALFKQAILELLEEKNEALLEALAEIIEEIALVSAIREGEGSRIVSREEVFAI